MPKNYDVEKQGHYRAARMRPPKKPAKVTPNTGAIDEIEADVEKRSATAKQ